MAGFQRELWTFIIVTMVALLIWAWAAGETREEATLDFAYVEFVTPQNWRATPPSLNVTVTLEGSKPALQEAERALRQRLEISVPPQTGAQSIDLMQQLRDHKELVDARVSLVSVDPSFAGVEVDEIIQVPARIRPVLPGVQTEGDVVVEPSEAVVAMPSLLRQRYPDELIVEAVVAKSRFDVLPPEIRHSLETSQLRLPEPVAGTERLTIMPETARVSFTIRSRIRELQLDSVRVQLAGPPEDTAEYEVTFAQPVVRDVTIRADADLVRAIESGAASVFAVVHLSNRDKEQRIESKRISYFMARSTTDEDEAAWRPVDARIADSAEMPVVGLQITRRDAKPAAPGP